jgi:hypothetical protein
MKNMSRQAPVYTAIVYHDDADDVTSVLTQALLSDEESLYYKDAQIVDTDEESRVFCRASLFGTITGFLIQVISLGAYAYMLMQWGDTAVQKDQTDWCLYVVLSIFTQVDLCIYVLIWLGFTCTMTRGGMAMVRDHLKSDVRRRFVFVTGVCFLVGIVLGAFVAWTMIDIYLGFPIPFLPIIVTVFVDLILCYIMIWCYDVGRGETLEDEEDTSCC